MCVVRNTRVCGRNVCTRRPVSEAFVLTAGLFILLLHPPSGSCWRAKPRPPGLTRTQKPLPNSSFRLSLPHPAGATSRCSSASGERARPHSPETLGPLSPLPSARSQPIAVRRPELLERPRGLIGWCLPRRLLPLPPFLSQCLLWSGLVPPAQLVTRQCLAPPCFPPPFSFFVTLRPAPWHSGL